MHLAHRARETVDLLRQETADFIPPDLWHPNILDMNPIQDLGYHATSCLLELYVHVAWINGG